MSISKGANFRCRMYAHALYTNQTKQKTKSKNQTPNDLSSHVERPRGGRAISAVPTQSRVAILSGPEAITQRLLFRGGLQQPFRAPL